jgi:hypothetical protein
MMNIFTRTCIALLFAISACATDIHPAMKRFADGKDIVVRERSSIYGYLKSPAISIQHIQEVQSGVMEYFFIRTNTLFVDSDKRCKFVFVVKKDTGTIIGWRYNDKPEYCLQSQ